MVANQEMNGHLDDSPTTSTIVFSDDDDDELVVLAELPNEASSYIGCN